jgi:2-amino-4-hydroxy-6-hydroxymethyldihydropteridine diphosphokinase
VEYTNQDDFYNQVLEFKLPNMSPDEVMTTLLEIELSLGRRRDIPKGPRTIDLDIIFFSDLKIQTELVNIPHPKLFERSFVVLPLAELPGFAELKKSFNFPMTFSNEAHPI